MIEEQRQDSRTKIMFEREISQIKHRRQLIRLTEILKRRILQNHKLLRVLVGSDC